MNKITVTVNGEAYQIPQGYKLLSESDLNTLFKTYRLHHDLAEPLIFDLSEQLKKASALDISQAKKILPIIMKMIPKAMVGGFDFQAFRKKISDELPEIGEFISDEAIIRYKNLQEQINNYDLQRKS